MPSVTYRILSVDSELGFGATADWDLTTTHGRYIGEHLIFQRSVLATHGFNDYKLAIRKFLSRIEERWNNEQPTGIPGSFVYDAEPALQDVFRDHADNNTVKFVPKH